MDLKKCSGYHGKCYHSEDKMVPINLFSKVYKDQERLASMCKTCAVEQHKKADPISNEVSRRAYKLAGGQSIYFELPKDDRVVLRNIVKSEMGKPTQPPKLTIVSNTPRFDDGRSASVTTINKRMPSGATREGPGYVYIYQDARVPRDLKIGAEKVSGGRLKSAGTWGLYTMLYNLKFDRRFEAEKAVHDALHQYRMYSNKELFAVDLDIAINAIETVALSHTTESK